MALQGHPRSLIFGTNRKRVCDFLLVINTSLVLSCPCFRDIEGFPRGATPPYSTQTLGVFPLHQIANVVASRSEDPKLIIHAITFELVQPIYIHERHRRTDRRADGRTTYDSNTALALCASRGKKKKINMNNIVQLSITVLTVTVGYIVSITVVEFH